MKAIVSDPTLVAYCGLYCGACKAYLKDKCQGCHDNVKATWCKVRSCCRGNQYSSCAECKEFSDPNDCKMFNNIISKIFSFIFRSNRAACIQQIREIGIQGHVDKMSEHNLHSLKR
ncbi:MAG TPA: DUF3795 domain-containing protein [Desulfatiglandales bacterium]|nr:DUF3795 domain-containing protein [Desulfatiglandales bacterium]